MVDREQPPGPGLIEEPCGQCGATATVEIGQSVVGGRIEWGVSIRCPRCGYDEQQCGRDEMPADLRDLLIGQDGLATLVGDREANRALRVRLLAVLRRRGATIEEAVAGYAALNDAGITGTAAEMELLADELTAAGAIVRLHPPGATP